MNMTMLRRLFALVLLSFVLFAAACAPASQPPAAESPAPQTDFAPPVTEPPEDPPDTLIVRYIDVGQGDAILLSCGGEHALIDTGSKDARLEVLNEIDAGGVKKLSLCVFTHPHSDHIGNAAAVLDRYQTEQIWMPDVVHTSKTYESLLDAILRHNIPTEAPSIGATFSLGSAVLCVLAPKSEPYRELNNYSIVLSVSHGERRFLFCGDAEGLSEYEMLESPSLLACDVLKVAHHGSTTSSMEAFLEAASPQVAVISVGEKNSYSHPAFSILQRLSDRGIAVYRTDINGTITAISDGATIEVTAEYKLK